MANVEHNLNWPYSFLAPMMDMRQNRCLTPNGLLPWLVGADGRSMGSIRRFPGFKRVAAIRPPADGTNKIDFFKPLTVKGYVSATGGYVTTRGFLYRIRTGAAEIHFFYYDPIRQGWKDASINAKGRGETSDWETAPMDAAAGPLFSYIAIEGSKGTTWLPTLGPGASGGAIVDTLGGDGIQEAVPDAPVAHPTTPTEAIAYPGLIDQNWHEYRLGMSNLLRGFRSPLSEPLMIRALKGSGAYGRIKLRLVNSVSALAEQYTCPTGLGRNFGYVELYRSVGNSFLDTPVGAGLFLERQFESAAFVGADPSSSVTSGDPGDGGLNDNQLSAEPLYSLLDMPYGRWPKGGLVCYYQGVLVTVGHLSSGIPADLSDALGQMTIRYSPLHERMLETFPANNQFRPTDSSDRFSAIVRVGDGLVVLSENGLYRLQMVGGIMSSQELFEGWGVVSRRAYAVAGKDLIYVSKSAVVMIEGNTGSMTTIGALDRLIQDSNFWGGSLSNISMAYDAPSQAVYILNPDKKQTAVIWLTTNTVSLLGDTDFLFVSTGQVPETGGVPRAMFLKDVTEHDENYASENNPLGELHGGVIYTIDADRSEPYSTNAGLRPDEVSDLNGTAQEGTDETTLYMAGTVRFPLRTEAGYAKGDLLGPDLYYGASVHVLVNGFWQKRTIVDSVGAYTDGGLNYVTGFVLDRPVTGLAAGASYSLAPIPFELMGWSLGVNPQDPTAPKDFFRRRVIESIGFNVVQDRGDLANGKMEVVAYRQLDMDPCNRATVAMSQLPSVNFGKSNVGGALLFPGLRCFTSNLDFELLGMVVNGRLDSSSLDRTQ